MDDMVNKGILNFFKNKKVLITGDTGFKGSWLAIWLNELGAKVFGFALPPEREIDHFNLLGLNKIINHIDGDIRNYDNIKKVFDEVKPEIVFHLAAQPIVRLSYQEPKLTLDTNIGGSINLLESLRFSSSVRSLVFITSDKCYKNKEWLWGYRENDELGGQDPYSASKSAAEIVFHTYFKSFFENRKDIGMASARAGNVIGGGDWAQDRIVPDCVKSLMANKPIIVRNPTATRPWQHVLEPLYGYLLLAVNLYQSPKAFSGAWNFGPHYGSFKSVQNLVDGIISNWGSGSIEYQINPNAPHEAGLLHLNCDKANQLLKWIPNWDFNKTVEETILWYKKFSENADILKLTKMQISKYTENLND
jgi:CDP-glucose 4,6-dehydratase